MHVYACPFCGSSDLEAKKIELRHVNPTTRATSTREVVELECRNCGWFGPVELATDVDAILEVFPQ